jgi:coproporphyrinogen III oxidase-like Fe-S oxidoreductase
MTDPLIRRYAGMPTPRHTCLTEDDRARQAIIRQLMCAFRAGLRGPARRNDLSKELALLRPMIRDGLVVQNRQVIAMTPLGGPSRGWPRPCEDSIRRCNS